MNMKTISCMRIDMGVNVHISEKLKLIFIAVNEMSKNNNFYKWLELDCDK